MRRWRPGRRAAHPGQLISTPFVLLATSVRKKPGGSGTGWIRSFPELDEQRHTVVDAMVRYLRSPSIRAVAADRKKLFERLQRNAGLLDRPTMLAIDRYDSALFRSLDHETLSSDARQRLDRQLLIFSGMWGLVRPTDQIPDYCLSMTSRMPQVSTLSSFWRPALSTAMNRLATDAVVWSLLPSQTAYAWTPGKHPTFRKRISLRFRDENGSDITSRMASNPVRGALARYIVEHEPMSVEDLAGFTETTGWIVDHNRLFRDGLRVGLVLAPSKTSAFWPANATGEPTVE